MGGSAAAGQRQGARPIVLATTNAHKIEEFRDLLADAPCEVLDPRALGLDLDVPETGTSFMENATIKALGWAEAGGIPALADDSGLEIDALDGAPGLYSSRWFPPDMPYTERCQRILAQLADVPPEGRMARYRCALVVAEPGRVLVAAEGVVEGRIAEGARGTGGFGYDPIFEVPGDGRTFGQMSAAEKHWISHRGRAVAAALPELRRICAPA